MSLWLVEVDVRGARLIKLPGLAQATCVQDLHRALWHTQHTHRAQTLTHMHTHTHARTHTHTHTHRPTPRGTPGLLSCSAGALGVRVGLATYATLLHALVIFAFFLRHC